MPFVQFRVHPGVGCARLGNSDKAYHLGAEFPYFLQEAFPNLRFKPKARVHPKAFFGGDAVASVSPPAALASYQIFDTTAAFDNKFKEAEGRIFPQGARFRVFAYVYDRVDGRHPRAVFEVTADIADITWKVNIANKKSKKTTAPPTDPHSNITATSADLDTSDTRLVCRRIRPVAGLPNLAYIFLERNDADKSKVTGRLHVIGNEGELKGTSSLTSLWSDDWYDSAGDGSVQAIVKPKGDGAELRALAGASKAADLKYLDYGTAAPQAGSAASIAAMPGWVVIACPDYVPDMGHFVSLWDLALDRGFHNLETGKVAPQPGKHKLIRTKTEFATYKETDYFVHIHPHLCLFDDVKFVSGDAAGDPENRPMPPEGRAHNSHPGALPVNTSETAAIKHGGMPIKARANTAALADPTRLKVKDSTFPMSAWLKRAIYNRLRKPGTLYDKKRKFVIVPPGQTGDGSPIESVFPRKLGRRMDFDPRPDGTFGPDRNKYYSFPNYVRHPGNLLKFHGLSDAGKLCGGAKSPPSAGPPGSTLSSDDLYRLKWLDDMYWPATYRDMPLLRELAYTQLQFDQFNSWQAPGTNVQSANIFDQIVAPAFKVIFARPGDADTYFAYLLVARPLYAPAMIDMAHLGAMLGGSFLPGIEVGREAGIAKNWCVFHGATRHFPSIRFKPCARDAEHTLGTLTKDLAVPWSEDFKDCDELFWPTSRPGRTTKDGVARHNWQITHDKPIPHLGAAGITGADLAARADAAEKAARADPSDAALAAAARAAAAAAAPFDIQFVKEYWKALGFIRRDTTDKFIEQEQSWH